MVLHSFQVFFEPIGRTIDPCGTTIDASHFSSSYYYYYFCFAYMFEMLSSLRSPSKMEM